MAKATIMHAVAIVNRPYWVVQAEEESVPKKAVEKRTPKKSK
jgi:hypothetical protein